MPKKLSRLVPELAFPPYTYIPNKTPHPVSDPAGHSFGMQPQSLAPALDDWQRSVAYRWGIDLFNQGYYWEAHEVWEGLWHAAGRTSPLAQVLQGLIKLAAAGVKTLAGSEQGRRRHTLRAAELFDQAAATTPAERGAIERSTGLRLSQLSTWARAAAAGGDGNPGATAEPRSVFCFRLEPSAGEGPSTCERPSAPLGTR